jgi:hypothetical protein
MKRCILALIALSSISLLEARSRRSCNKGHCETKTEVASCDPQPCCVKSVTVKAPAIRKCHYTWVCPEGYEVSGEEHESK